MRPFHHARASAAQSGRDWRDDLEVHEFLDSSKAAFADLRHRMILHSVDLGAELAARAFPARSDVRDIVRRHVIEDIGEPRTLPDWLGHCNVARLPRAHPSALPIQLQDLVERERSRQKLAHDDGPASVLEILRLPLIMAPDFGDVAWCVLGNTLGVSLVRRILGPARELSGARGLPVIFDPAWCAEAMICTIFRTIPDLRSVVTTLRTPHLELAHVG
ncbi:MAG: hypothetical protein FJX20_19210 [Alphaproteobacteria bacterium]|nr:hypothetical protein [Alphaproteobacteria bacterium]